MPSFGDFVHTQFVLNILKPTASFGGKTVIVTGANGGLGKETAKHIVRLGAAKVILGCRSQSRGQAAKHEIETSLKCDPSVLEVWEVDLESAASIRGFVSKANALPRMDVLVNNAGLNAVRFKLVYGTERSIAVNVIGTFLLSVQLVPKLVDTARQYNTTPHMTFVTSALYDTAKYTEGHGADIFAWFAEESRIDTMNQYNLSKLMQLLAAIKLAAALDHQGVVVNSLDPCFCKTGLPRELTGAMRVGIRVFEAIAARSPEEGARLVVMAASAGMETHGLYMRAGEVRKYVALATDDKKATYVWKLVCKKLEELQPGVMRNLEC